MEESTIETSNILYPLRAQSWEFLDPFFLCLEERTKTKSTIWVACSNPTSQSSTNMSSNPSNMSTTGFCGLLSVLLGSLSGSPVSSSRPCFKQDPILVSKTATLLLSIFLIVLKPLLKLLGQRTDSFFHLPQWLHQFPRNSMMRNTCWDGMSRSCTKEEKSWNYQFGVYTPLPSWERRRNLCSLVFYSPLDVHEFSQENKEGVCTLECKAIGSGEGEFYYPLNESRWFQVYLTAFDFQGLLFNPGASNISQEIWTVQNHENIQFLTQIKLPVVGGWNRDWQQTGWEKLLGWRKYFKTKLWGWFLGGPQLDILQFDSILT